MYINKSLLSVIRRTKDGKSDVGKSEKREINKENGEGKEIGSGGNEKKKKGRKEKRGRKEKHFGGRNKSGYPHNAI